MVLPTRRKSALLALAIAAALVASCGAPATPAATATSPPPTIPPPTMTLTAKPPTATATEGIAEGNYPEIPRISLEEAKAAYDAGSAIFVDVRSPAKYEVAHVRGAINIPFREVEKHIGELDKEKWIITYCI